MSITSQQPYQYHQRHYNLDMLKSSYQDNYKQQPVTAPDSPSRFESVGTNIVRRVPFTGASSYKDQFKPFTVKPAHNPENPQYHHHEQEMLNYESSPPPRSPVKFEGISSYKCQFTDPPKPQQKQAPQNNYVKVQIPFNGNSSYKSDFPGYQYDIKPQKEEDYMPPSPYKSRVKFEGNTSYHEQFKGNLFKTQRKEEKSQECMLDRMKLPEANEKINRSHLYYDEKDDKFI